MSSSYKPIQDEKRNIRSQFIEPQHIGMRSRVPSQAKRPLRRYVTPAGERARRIFGSPSFPENDQWRATKLEIVDGNVILHRGHNFFVRTTVRAFQRGVVDPLRKPTGGITSLSKLMPEQESRVASRETRLMPRLTSMAPLNTEHLPIPTWVEGTLVVFGLLMSLVAHAVNMFNFPRYELDEGTYMSNAWAILHHHVSVYAYGYGHPPVGWIQIAVWVQLVGGFFAFGNALNTGRVLMLFYAVGCSLLVYLIVCRLGGSRSAALLAMIICSLSPLSITYQRQVLLDNIGIFWFLLSLYFLVASNSRLLYIVGSAIAFGIAILSKEIFLLFTAVMIYGVWLHTTAFQRKFTLVAFIYIVAALSSSFVLMAILKGELFPYSWHLPWDHHPHLSMLDTFIGQAQRGQNEGSFTDSWKSWFKNDALLLLGSIVSLVFNLVVGWWKRQHLLLALLGISFWVLLLRGGVVFAFYIIPLIPLIAMNAAFTINTLLQWISNLIRFDIVRAVLVISIIGAIAPYDLMGSGIIFTQHSTSAQVEAMTWIRKNIPHNAFIVINSYLYMDLHLPGGKGGDESATYPFAHVYFNVATDPELRDAILHDQWNRIDYIIVDSEMLHNIQQNSKMFKILSDALAPGHSMKRAEFRSPDVIITVYEVKHTVTPPNDRRI